MTEVIYDIAPDLPDENQRIMKWILFGAFCFLGGALLTYGYFIFGTDSVSFAGVYDPSENSMKGTWSIDRLPTNIDTDENTLYAIEFTGAYIKFKGEPVNHYYLENIGWYS